MRPRLELLGRPLIERVLAEAFLLIQDPGVRVAPYVVELLRSAGIDVADGIAHPVSAADLGPGNAGTNPQSPLPAPEAP